MINTVSQTVQGYSSLILNTISSDHLSDPCSPNPCLNDGTCFSSSDSNPSYICVCVNGYTETNCQTCELYLHILQVLVIHVVIQLQLTCTIYNTTWWVSVLRSTVLAVISILLSEAVYGVVCIQSALFSLSLFTQYLESISLLVLLFVLDHPLLVSSHLLI